MRFGINSLRLGFALIIIGVFVPLVCLPMLDGYQRNADLLTNIQSMSLPITPDKKTPDFREIASLDSEQGITEVKYGQSDMTLAFPASMSNDEITTAIKAETQFQKKDLPKFMRFYGWTVIHNERNISFKYIASTGLLFVFAGLIVLVWRMTQSKNATH
ncbi:MAG: hypothetical protein ACREDS_01040 [Limisphaerales bacterium]